MRARWMIITAGFFVGLCSSALVEAQQPYPRVYGSTGHPYGPTQAHYQYQRQYGQRWHGYDASTSSTVISTGTPFLGTTVYGGWGNGLWVGGSFPGMAWGFYGPTGYAPPVAYAPGLSYYGPAITTHYGYYGTPGAYLPYPNHAAAQNPALLNAPLADAWRENQLRWGTDLPPSKPDPITRPALPSSTEAKLRSVRAQMNGDEHLRQQKWQHAYVEYKKAVEAADDRADAHFRLGIALVTIQHYDTALIAFQRALHLDPQLPQSGLTLRSLYGENSDLTINSIISRMTSYAEQDIRDPNRLFLLGVMLHFHGDPRAREILDVGYRLAGRGSHFLAFLQPQPVIPANPVKNPAAPAVAEPLTLPPAPLTPVIPGPQTTPDANSLPEPPRPSNELVPPAVTNGPLLPPPVPE
ncbi:MAG TPA: tetratricopeptide repeat protein [Planctomycetaceae bacterium]|nr:tetratricopeptide repeat protein [Planctomycetaceae bacterium]